MKHVVKILDQQSKYSHATYVFWISCAKLLFLGGNPINAFLGESIIDMHRVVLLVIQVVYKGFNVATLALK